MAENNSKDPQDWLTEKNDDPTFIAVYPRLVSCVSERCGFWLDRFARLGRLSRGESYVARSVECATYHWFRLSSAKDRIVTAEEVLENLEDLSANTKGLIRDVVLAQAIEAKEHLAAETFNVEFMPMIRAIATQILGRRSEDVFQNYLAHLIILNSKGRSKLSTFRGRTSLANWLRVVATNHCREILRREANTEQLVDQEVVSKQVCIECDSIQCKSVLEPVFTSIIRGLECDDRLMIKQLILDKVPQQLIAKAMGVHPGNITRKRDKVLSSIWSSVAILTHGNSLLRDCLDLVLANNQQELKLSLAEVIAKAVRQEGLAT